MKQSPPSQATLKRYGLSKAEWKQMYKAQKGLCGVCQQEKRLVIDHEHAPGWKGMPPEKRKLYVRALCCSSCNHWVLGYRVTARLHRLAAEYLEAYEKRRPK